MINYCDPVTVLTRTSVDDNQGGLTETWSSVHKATFDLLLISGALAVGTTVEGGENGYTAVVTEIDYATGVIRYASLSNLTDFEVDEQLTDQTDPDNNVVLTSVLGTIESEFYGRLAKISGDESVMASKMSARSTHVLYSPIKPITSLNRIQFEDKIYNVVSVNTERDLFGMVKHMETQLELIE